MTNGQIQEWTAEFWESVSESQEQWEPKELCLIEAFIRQEQKKPPHLRSQCVMISCHCHKCRVVC